MQVSKGNNKEIFLIELALGSLGGKSSVHNWYYKGVNKVNSEGELVRVNGVTSPGPAGCNPIAE